MRHPPRPIISAILILAMLTTATPPAEAHTAEEVLELNIDALELLANRLTANRGVFTRTMLLELLTTIEANAALYTPPPTKTANRSRGALTIGASAEQWRPLVAAYFPASQVDYALAVLWCESKGDPNAANPRSSARGLFQHLARYWPERSSSAGYAGASILDPTANIAVAAWLVNDAAGGGWGHWTCRP